MDAKWPNRNGQLSPLLPWRDISWRDGELRQCMYRRWLSHVGWDFSRSVPFDVQWPKRNYRNGQFSLVALGRWGATAMLPSFHLKIFTAFYFQHGSFVSYTYRCHTYKLGSVNCVIMLSMKCQQWQWWLGIGLLDTSAGCKDMEILKSGSLARVTIVSEWRHVHCANHIVQILNFYQKRANLDIVDLF